MSEATRLVVSFSGGETSGWMAKLCKERLSNVYSEMVFIIANTSQENEATLVFADECDKAFGLNLVWLEADINPEAGKGTGFKVVTFETAHRNGEIFEEMIKKYGIPNKGFPHCTRELKERPITAYVRDALGWEKGTFDIAIGIRADEKDRMSDTAREKGLIYPLAARHMWPHRKSDVNENWASMPFRLQIPGFKGNCRACWKKSDRKLFTIALDTPQDFAFCHRMEQEYPLAGTNPAGIPRVFFREKRSADDMLRLAQTTEFTPAIDDARHYQADFFPHDGWDDVLDVGGDCEETCEVKFDEVA